MTAQNFCYWLQGFSEVANKAPNQREWQVILDHLKIVDGLNPSGLKFFPHTNVLSGTHVPVLERSQTKYC